MEDYLKLIKDRYGKSLTDAQLAYAIKDTIDSLTKALNDTWPTHYYRREGAEYDVRSIPERGAIHQSTIDKFFPGYNSISFDFGSRKALLVSNSTLWENLYKHFLHELDLRLDTCHGIEKIFSKKEDWITADSIGATHEGIADPKAAAMRLHDALIESTALTLLSRPSEYPVRGYSDRDSAIRAAREHVETYYISFDGRDVLVSPLGLDLLGLDKVANKSVTKSTSPGADLSFEDAVTREDFVKVLESEQKAKDEGGLGWRRALAHDTLAGKKAEILKS